MNALLVAVVGGSASGKTTLARSLVDALHPASAMVSLDAFYRCADHLSPARRDRLDFDNPRRIDWPLLSRVLDEALAGRPARVPRYSFERHAREPLQDTLPPSRYLVLEGLWVLRRREIRRRCALKVFVDCPEFERLRRRVRRDMAERGRTRSQVLRQWRDQSEPGFRRFVEPQRAHADRIVRSPVAPRRIDELVREIRALAGESS
ncbi:MAG: hypothetical protein JNL97_06505 [Verrucomicrobiales bacterium]|nr:hypothetical protein [Verrucomicrobiales bacterium]